MDRVRLEWMDRNQVRGNDLEHMIVNAEDKARGCRRVDKSQKILFAFPEDFAEDWLAFVFR